MRIFSLLMGFVLVMSISPLQTLQAAEVRPLYEVSDDKPSSLRPITLPGFSTHTSLNFSSWSVGGVNPVSGIRSVGISSRVSLYSIGTDALPSETPLNVRRASTHDEYGDIPGGGQGNPENTPVGSSAILVLFALAYVAYLAYKKRLSYINR